MDNINVLENLVKISFNEKTDNLITKDKEKAI